MLARKQPQSIVLKSILSELTYAEKLKPMSTNSSTQHVTTVSSDEAAMQVLQKMIRKRQDSIEQYRNGQRPDLAAKEQQELELIQTYLPQQMSEGEIKSVVEQVMQRLKIGGGGGGGNSGKQVGLIMKEMRLLMDPARAPPSVVSAVVKEMLSKL
jgi:uncharacterized protein YqeY